MMNIIDWDGRKSSKLSNILATAMNREDRINVYNEDLEVLRKGYYETVEGERINFPPVDEVMSAARFYASTDPVPAGSAKYETKVEVENLDCVVAAKHLMDIGCNPAVLNLADLYVPGGIIELGAGTQEENLCRRSNLILSLYQFSPDRISQYPDLGLKAASKHYPMSEHTGGIYSGIVTFFRDTEAENYAILDRPFNLPVISVAAIDQPNVGPDGIMCEADTRQTLEKMRTIFRIGYHNGHDSLVLGAFGCGAFANPPAHIARLFHQVIEEPEFKNVFKFIDFAIIGRPGTDGVCENFLAFDQEW